MPILKLYYNFNIILLSPRRIFCLNNKPGIHLTSIVLVSTYISDRFITNENVLLQMGWEVQEYSFFSQGYTSICQKN